MGPSNQRLFRSRSRFLLCVGIQNVIFQHIQILWRSGVATAAVVACNGPSSILEISLHMEAFAEGKTRRPGNGYDSSGDPPAA